MNRTVLRVFFLFPTVLHAHTSRHTLTFILTIRWFLIVRVTLLTSCFSLALSCCCVWVCFAVFRSLSFILSLCTHVHMYCVRFSLLNLTAHRANVISYINDFSTVAFFQLPPSTETIHNTTNILKNNIYLIKKNTEHIWSTTSASINMMIYKCAIKETKKNIYIFVN